MIPVELVRESRYGDGPVFVRVNKAVARSSWPVAPFVRRIDELRFRADPEHDYVEAQNSHSAFVYTRWMRDDGVCPAAISVVRIVRARPDTSL